MWALPIFPALEALLIAFHLTAILVVAAPAPPDTLSGTQLQDPDEYRDPDAQQDALLDANKGVGHMVTNVYDPRSRDFTSRCLRMAQYSGPKACEVFNNCCSEDLVLNRLNGDRCQRADSTNGCTPNFQGDGIQWSQCKAYNCSEEVTTTSTTTMYPPRSGAPLMSTLNSALLLLLLTVACMTSSPWAVIRARNIRC